MSSVRVSCETVSTARTCADDSSCVFRSFASESCGGNTGFPFTCRQTARESCVASWSSTLPNAAHWRWGRGSKTFQDLNLKTFNLSSFTFLAHSKSWKISGSILVTMAKSWSPFQSPWKTWMTPHASVGTSRFEPQTQTLKIPVGQCGIFFNTYLHVICFRRDGRDGFHQRRGPRVAD